MKIFDKLFSKKTIQPTTGHEKEGIENRDWNNYPNLRGAILKVRSDSSDKWDLAKSIFEDEIKKMPDYDVPYIWLSDYYRNYTHEIGQALDILNKGVKLCIRKTSLLNEMGEISLLDERNIRNAVHYFAESIKISRGRKSPNDYTFQNSYLYLNAIFAYYGMSMAAKWAENQARSGDPGDIEFTGDLLTNIHSSISNAVDDISKKELEKIYNDLKSYGF